MDLIRLIAALALPWLAGAALVALVCRHDVAAGRDGTTCWITGVGWFVGVMLVTLLMRLESKVGIAFSGQSLGSVLVGLTVLFILPMRAFVPAWRTAPRRARDVLVGAGLPASERVVWIGLLAWIAARLLMVLSEDVLRPLFPWEAWTVWATKAKVFFALGHIVPFADADAWQAANGSAWFDARPQSPITLPLLQTWMATMAGRWDDAFVATPWSMALLALALATFGGLRRVGMPNIVSLVAVWLIVSLPLLDVNAALAGYADLFVAAFLVLGALSLLQWQRERSIAAALQTLFLAVSLSLVKPSGVFWAACLAAGGVVAGWPARGMRIVAGGIGLAVFGALVLSRTPQPLGDPTWHLEFAPDVQLAIDSALLLGSWHLLWYGVVAMALFGYRHAFSPALAPLTAVALCGLVYLLALTVFPAAASWLSDVNLLNQGALQLAPVATIWMIAVFQAWSSEWHAKRRPIRPAVTDA